eukprot:13129968-Alexandrium_andersonii.AAC.1
MAVARSLPSFWRAAALAPPWPLSLPPRTWPWRPSGEDGEEPTAIAKDARRAASGGREAARPSPRACSLPGVSGPLSGEKGCVGEMSGGPRRGEAATAGLVPLDTSIGEGE